MLANLIEKKKTLQKIMRGEVDLRVSSPLKDIPDESIPLPKEKRTKSKNIEMKEPHDDGGEKISTKKSMSTSCVNEPSKPSQPIQESPSMSVLTSKVDDISLTSPSNPDTSFKETLSDFSSGGTTTTTTITITTTDDATIVTKEDLDHDDDYNRESSPVASKEEEEKPSEKNTHANFSDAIMANGSCKNMEKDDPIIIEEQDVYQIVESIRKNTNLSHELSQLALRVFISEMEALLPEISRYLDPIAVHLTTNSLTVPDNLLGETHDSLRLRNIFLNFADAKNDLNQRSWMLYEDEVDISNYLTELIRILVDADPKICRYEMSCDKYNSINNLVLYYQMESRWTIRKLLLKTFKAMCLLDLTCVDILISSVLPLELVQDMLTNPENLEKLSELSVMLIMIFSAGHKMPIGHFDLMRHDFVLFMLNLIENPLEDDQTEFLSDVMLNLLLAFNLQFDNFAENIILEAMQQIKTSKSFTEKILLLINREDDPVFVLKHTKPPVNSVLKILIDLFSISETANFFYTNDIKVLIDILVRQLSDLSSGDPVSVYQLSFKN